MIRNATKKDVENINSLGDNLFSNFRQTYNIDEYLDNENYILLVNVEKIINAFLIIYKNIDFYELEAIIVREDFRGKHIASNLLNYFIDNYLKRGDKILLEVDTSNEKAIKLYKKFDFRIINIRKHYYNKNDAYVMEKVI